MNALTASTTNTEKIILYDGLNCPPPAAGPDDPSGDAGPDDPSGDAGPDDPSGDAAFVRYIHDAKIIKSMQNKNVNHFRHLLSGFITPCVINMAMVMSITIKYKKTNIGLKHVRNAGRLRNCIRKSTVKNR
jgi:hypothetical protein